MLSTIVTRVPFFLTLSLAAILATGVSQPVLGQATKTKAADKAKLDLNKATAKELEAELPGVGEVTAKKIVEGRPYNSVDDLSKIGLSAKTIDGIRPLVVVTAPAAAKAAPRTTTAATPKPATNEAPVGKVNLNTATLKELETLPGVGPAIAKEIVDARPLKAIEDLEKLKGLGKAKIAALKDHVVFSDAVPATTKAVAPSATAKGAMTKAGTPKSKAAAPAPGKLVNLNTASKDELDALPGIGPVRAQAIIDARPFKTKEDVMKVKGIKQVEFGKIKDMITVD
jgi:competence protein ComEA